ncbi:MAG: hypothetical protein AVDCRST_MAG53-98, partial [uncultured Solirubrobacteraceae bacterium]
CSSPTAARPTAPPSGHGRTATPRACSRCPAGARRSSTPLPRWPRVTCSSSSTPTRGCRSTRTRSSPGRGPRAATSRCASTARTASRACSARSTRCSAASGSTTATPRSGARVSSSPSSAGTGSCRSWTTTTSCGAWSAPPARHASRARRSPRRGVGWPSVCPARSWSGRSSAGSTSRAYRPRGWPGCTGACA